MISSWSVNKGVRVALLALGAVAVGCGSEPARTTDPGATEAADPAVALTESAANAGGEEDLLPEELAGLHDAPVAADSVDSVRGGAVANSSGCDTGCALVSWAGCSLFGIFNPPGGIACGLGTIGLCADACSGDNRKCVSASGGGKACTTRTRFWYCDTQVDGHGARAWYTFKDASLPGQRHTDWAPTKACNIVGFPNGSLIKQYRICVYSEGCSPWVEP